MLSQVQPPSSVGSAPQQQQQQQNMFGSQLQQAEVLYQSQLEQMQMMGFPNKQANLNGNGFRVNDFRDEG